MLIRKARSALQKYRMVNPGDRVLVGVSGGPDSVALLHVLCRLRSELGIELHVVHLNHMFRGPEAEADAEAVRELAQRLGVPCTVERRNVPAYQAQRRISAQEAAREVRYSFFAEMGCRLGAARVALGHNADDQAETVLLNFLRGAGPSGIKGMLPVRDNFYIRPLIEVRRAEIEDYCRRHRLPFRVDSSNLKTVYTRNKIRLELLPLLKREYNPNLVRALLNLSDICREEDSYLEEQALKAYRLMVTFTDGCVRLELEKLKDLPLALQRRVLRRAWRDVSGGHQDLDFYHLEGVLNLARSRSGSGRLILPKGFVARRRYDFLDLLRGEGELSGSQPYYCYELEVPGDTVIREAGLVVKARVIEKECSPPPDELLPGEVLLDYDKLAEPLVVRCRLPGDRFFPLGARGSKKLKEFLIDQKVPREERDRIPVLVSGEKIAWVGGLRPAEWCKVVDSTVNCLHLRLQRVD